MSRCPVCGCQISPGDDHREWCPGDVSENDFPERPMDFLREAEEMLGFNDE